MTDSTTTTRVSYTGDGSSTNFTITFPFYLSTDILVQLAGATVTSGYSVSGGNGSTGTLVMATPPAEGVNVQAILNPPLTQAVNLVDGTAFPSATLNQVNDRAVQIGLRLQDQINRTPRAPDGDAAPQMLLPSAANRANKALMFDSNGNISVGVPNTQVITTDLLAPFLNLSRTSAEIAAQVTPTNYGYVPGNVKRYGATGSGVTDDSSAIQSAISCASNGQGFVYFPAGTYLHASTLVFKNNCKYYGDSCQTSILLYTGTSDQAQVNNPINSSTVANYVVQDLWLKSQNATSGKANWADVGSGFVYFSRVQFSGAKIGLILDQSEVVRITNPIMNAVQSGGAGIWLVNGPEHTGGASLQFTNDIVVQGGQFNGAGVLIADDGGISHKFINNDFNAGTSQIRCNNVNGLIVEGNEMEVPTTTCVDFQTTKWGGASGTGTNGAKVTGNVMVVGSKFCLQFANNGANTLEFSLNIISNTVGNPFNNINGGIFTDLVASGNVQASTGNGNDLINNYFQDAGGWVPTWGGSGGTPSLGNGTFSTTYTRRGKEVLIRLTYVFGSTTTFAGTSWTFTLPVTAASETVNYLGNVFAAVAGVTNTSGVTVSGPVATTLSIKSSAGTWGNGTPGAWASGDFISMSTTFKAANWIG